MYTQLLLWSSHFDIYCINNYKVDFNKENFAAEEVYTNSPNGQPSLIYAAELKPEVPLVMAELLGHGHISGGDGAINPDVSNVTTALSIFKGFVVEVE